MKTCPKCGAPVAPEARECPRCGTKTGGRFLKEPQKATGPSIGKWIWIPIVAVVLVAAIAFGAAALLGGREDSRMEAATEPLTVPTTEAPTTEPPTEAPTTEPPTEPPTEPAPVYRNPLNGEILDEPYTGRIFISTISNVPDALPHVSANQADIVFETFVNYSIIRCIGLYSNISEVEQIGSVRSTRIMFNDITEHYGAILFHAGGSGQVLQDARDRGIENFSVDTWDATQAGISIRDEYRKRYIGLEHSLLALGPTLEAYAETQGYSITGDPEKDYLLRFTEDGTPADGEEAGDIAITITQSKYKKDTILNYAPELGKYVYSQYGEVMKDGVTEEPEAYTNVIIMEATIGTEGMYQVADFVLGGEGYFACGGKIIRIKWTCDGEDQPFRFMTMDGEDLQLGVGNTYIAITEPGFALTYGPGTWVTPEAPETVPEEGAVPDEGEAPIEEPTEGTETP